jgi:hypothetical protein
MQRRFRRSRILKCRKLHRKGFNGNQGLENSSKLELRHISSKYSMYIFWPWANNTTATNSDNLYCIGKRAPSMETTKRSKARSRQIGLGELPLKIWPHSTELSRAIQRRLNACRNMHLIARYHGTENYISCFTSLPSF